MIEQPEITRVSLLSVQVCVPSDWTDEQAIDFAESKNPCGTTNGWQVRTDIDRMAGYPERNPCDTREGFVHIMLDC